MSRVKIKPIQWRQKAAKEAAQADYERRSLVDRIKAATDKLEPEEKRIADLRDTWEKSVRFLFENTPSQEATEPNKADKNNEAIANLYSEINKFQNTLKHMWNEIVAFDAAS